MTHVLGRIATCAAIAVTYLDGSAIVTAARTRKLTELVKHQVDYGRLTARRFHEYLAGIEARRSEVTEAGQ